MPINWTEIIITLGSALISGFFAFLSRKGAGKAAESAKVSRLHADRAVEASLSPMMRNTDNQLEFDFNEEKNK